MYIKAYYLNQIHVIVQITNASYVSYRIIVSSKYTVGYSELYIEINARNNAFRSDKVNDRVGV
jgi:hypothetical protein